MIVNDSWAAGTPDHSADPTSINYELIRRRAVWSVFDAVWYLARHPDAGLQMQALGITQAEQFYVEHGARLGHSPNMFFDEAYYLRTNPDVALQVDLGTIR